MKFIANLVKKDPFLVTSIILLLLIGILVLRSIAPFVFPYYYVFIVLGTLGFVIFSQIEFEVLKIFKWQIYILCIVFLIIPLIIGQVTRGAVRWIPIGPLTLQPSELVRPFLFVFFAAFLTEKAVGIKRMTTMLILLALPLLLILVQPSLGVTVLTFTGVVGILLASHVNKKLLLTLAILCLISLPIIWFLLAPYQKGRVMTFLSPQSDPTGAGYNSIQSMISVGSGRIWGRGLGEGVQTQLAFLPERHTDFVFASVAEELGFAGSIVLIIASFYLLLRIINQLQFTKSLAARCFIAGMFLSLFVQTVVHIGMNMGLLPITGVPLPLVSSGGSSLLATMVGLGIVLSTR